MLDRDPSSVEDFVEHLSILTKINNELPSLEKEFKTVTRLFTIANDFSLQINPEQYAFFKSLGSTFQHLKVSFYKVYLHISFFKQEFINSQAYCTPKRNVKKTFVSLRLTWASW